MTCENCHISASIRCFTGTQPCSTVSVLAMADTTWPIKPQIFTTWLFRKKKKKERKSAEPQTEGSLLQERTFHSSDADRAPRTSTACSVNDIQAAFPPPQKQTIEVWVWTDRCMQGILQGTRRTVPSPRAPPPSRSSSRAEPPAPAPHVTTPGGVRREQRREAPAEAAPASLRPTSRHAATEQRVGRVARKKTGGREQ